MFEHEEMLTFVDLVDRTMADLKAEDDKWNLYFFGCCCEKENCPKCGWCECGQPDCIKCAIRQNTDLSSAERTAKFEVVKAERESKKTFKDRLAKSDTYHARALGIKL